MPRLKTITFVVSALLAAAGSYAAPFQQRGLDKVIEQCKHNFAYVSFLFPTNHVRWYHAPTTKTNPVAKSYTFDDGPYKWNTDLVKKFDSVGAKTTFCSFHLSIRRK